MYKNSSTKMKRIPWSQFVLELDRLFFGGHIADMTEAEQRADTIDAYLEACGYTWDSVLEAMSNEGNDSNQN